MNTHNLCFGAKIRKKIGIPVHTPVLLYIKVGFKGVFITRTCFRNVNICLNAVLSNSLCDAAISLLDGMLAFFFQSSVICFK